MTAYAALAVNKGLESKLDTLIALAATTVPKGELERNATFLSCVLFIFCGF